MGIFDPPPPPSMHYDVIVTKWQPLLHTLWADPPLSSCVCTLWMPPITHLSIGVDGRGAAGRRLYPSMQRISTFDSLCSDIHLFINTMHTDWKRIQARNRTYICKCVPQVCKKCHWLLCRNFYRLCLWKKFLWALEKFFLGSWSFFGTQRKFLHKALAIKISTQ